MNPVKWLRYNRSTSADAIGTEYTVNRSETHKPSIHGAQKFAAALSLLSYPSPDSSSSQDHHMAEVFEQRSTPPAAPYAQTMTFTSHLPSPALSSGSKRRPRKLRKPPPSAYPIEMNTVAAVPSTPSLSFVPDEIPFYSNFPDFTHETSPPGTPHSSNHGSVLFIPSNPNRSSTYSVPSSPSMSMRSALTMASYSQVPLLNSFDLDLESRTNSGLTKRKLTKRRPSAEPPSSYAPLPEQYSEVLSRRSHTYPPSSQHTPLIKHPQRRSTLSLGFKSKKHSENYSPVPPVPQSANEYGQRVHVPELPEPAVHAVPLMQASSFFKQMPAPIRPYLGMSSPDVRTHEMIDLVWNGHTAFPSTPAFEKQRKFTIGSEPEFDDPITSATRPTLIRRHAGLPVSPPRRRWTLAAMMNDEEMTDEVLVEELERMRRGDDNLSTDTSWRKKMTNENQEQWNQNTPVHNSVSMSEDGHHAGQIYTEPKFQMSAPDLALIHTNWHTARRALLTCRDLVRTERHYLSALQSLALGETASPPPPLMLRYVKDLVAVSDALLARLENNPSAWGVAAAFMSLESDLEHAFTSWCGVVGTWFQGNANTDSARQAKSSRRGSLGSKNKANNSVDDNVIARVSPLRRASMSWRKSSTSIYSLTETTKIQRAHAVRDLAILPTQRIMRYVLLFKDLLAHTPASSPSRPLVECALEASCRIAAKCDSAQTNAAFIV